MQKPALRTLTPRGVKSEVKFTLSRRALALGLTELETTSKPNLKRQIVDNNNDPVVPTALSASHKLPHNSRALNIPGHITGALSRRWFVSQYCFNNGVKLECARFFYELALLQEPDFNEADEPRPISRARNIPAKQHGPGVGRDLYGIVDGFGADLIEDIATTFKFTL